MKIELYHQFGRCLTNNDVLTIKLNPLRKIQALRTPLYERDRYTSSIYFRIRQCQQNYFFILRNIENQRTTPS